MFKKKMFLWYDWEAGWQEVEREIEGLEGIKYATIEVSWWRYLAWKGTQRLYYYACGFIPWPKEPKR